MESFTQKKTSVLILTYFSEHEIANCLRGILKGSDDRIEVIIIDNNSQDGTRTILKNEFEQYQQVHITYNQENIGFARGVNQAAKAATGDYLLILNPDTIINTDQILHLVDFLQDHPDVGVVGPRIVDEHGMPQESYGDSISIKNEFFGKIFHSKYLEKIKAIAKWKRKTLEKTNIQDVGWIGGACMMIPRKLFQSIGGIDEHFFFSYVDMIDLAVRVKYQGLRIVLDSTISIVHIGSKSVPKNRDKALYETYTGGLYYFKKHHGPVMVLFARIVYAIVSFIKATSAGFVSILKKREYGEIARAHFKNAIRMITNQTLD